MPTTMPATLDHQLRHDTCCQFDGGQVVVRHDDDATATAIASEIERRWNAHEQLVAALNAVTAEFADYMRDGKKNAVGAMVAMNVAASKALGELGGGGEGR